MRKKRRDPKHMGKRLRELRGIRTRTGVVRQLGISYSLLSFYERGDRFPSEENQKKLANYYGVSVDDLFYTVD